MDYLLETQWIREVHHRHLHSVINKVYLKKKILLCKKWSYGLSTMDIERIS